MCTGANYQIYERCVAAFTAQDEDSLSITIGSERKNPRYNQRTFAQIDASLSKISMCPTVFRLIVDAKHRKRNLDIDDVEAFEGKMRDVQACHGILVASSGVTKSAIKRAQFLDHDYDPDI